MSPKQDKPTFLMDEEDSNLVFPSSEEEDHIRWFKDYMAQREQEEKQKQQGATKEVYHNKYNNINSTQSTTKSTSTSTSSSTSYGTAYTFHSHKPTIAFEYEGIQFIGTAKTYLDDIKFYDTDLIINCTGLKFEPKPPKPFIKEVPKWMKIKPDPVGLAGQAPPQLLLDWPDWGAPDGRIDIEFWKEVYESAKANGIERIICCCTGGSGRTGTALAALALAAEVIDEPDEAIKFIRKEYNDKAIESKSQELYLWSLIYDDDEIFGNNATETTTDSKQLPVKVSDKITENNEMEDWMNNYGWE